MSSRRALILRAALVLVTFGFAAERTESKEPAPQTGPLPPVESARAMSVPEGFSVTLCASEPEVRQPIAFTIDTKGRVWVAESFTYPEWLQSPKENDRILIFEDQDGDGKFDRRTVFWDRGGKVANITGLALGFGGVWVCATPNLLFIPDLDGDDRPDGAPAIVLDGWDVRARHNLFNGLNWGPDGWLYGCNGILSNSNVGRPGTPDNQRVAINCGVWRYHPTKKVFEDVAHGTTNPWGLDFDDHGEAFITNCVIPHLFHVVPGAHFQRMFGQDMSPYSFGLISSVADHIHWAGGNWTESRGGKGKHGEAGGGHAHVGAMIYLGDNWPSRYRDSVFTCNIHGRRINNDILERSGSSYVARHGRDFLTATDEWFRGLELKYGPDGGVYLTDWSDTGECHETDSDLAHRENGRIFKIAYGKPRAVKVDLGALSDEELVRLQLHQNDWYVRNARRVLQERAAAGKEMSQAHRGLRQILADNTDVTRKLRAVWALHATSGLSKADLLALLDHADEYLRGWAVRLLVESKDPGRAALKKFGTMAREDRSAYVRLALAAALQRIAPEQRWPIAEGLAGHSEDADDSYLPLMTWYGIEPAVSKDPAQAITLLGHAKIGLLRQYLARRLLLLDEPPLGALAKRLADTKEAGAQSDILAGALEALRARKAPAIPAEWPPVLEQLATSRDPVVRERALLVALRLNDPRAVVLLKEIMMRPGAAVEERRRAVFALAEKRVPGITKSLLALLDDHAVRAAAIRGLAAYDDPAGARELVERYRTFSDSEKSDAISTLASRGDFAQRLLSAVEAGTIPRRDLTAAIARQLQAFGNPQISERLAKVWGSVRPTSTEKSAAIARYKALLAPDLLKAADPARGRAVFNRTCLQCHRLYDSGGDVGPDLTGSDRANQDYILENVLDPSALVGNDFRLTTVATADGRLLSGIIREQTDKSVVLQTVNERHVLLRDEIEAMKPTDASMMPEGLFEKLSPEEVRDLVAYLTGKAQVPLPREPASP